MSLDNLIDGRAIAKEVHAETEVRVAALKADGVEPCLVFIRVGEDPASRVYVGMKERTAAKLGIRSETTVLPENTPEAELLELLEKLNADDSVHGVLVQAPLPVHIDETRIFSTVSPSKDIDGFHPVNVGKLMLGEGGGFVPCTPGGVHELLIRSGVTVEGTQVVVLGRGNIVGKPMTAILCQKDKHAKATVTLCHSRSSDVAEHCRRADIIVAAMGVAESAPSFEPPARGADLAAEFRQLEDEADLLGAFIDARAQGADGAGEKKEKPKRKKKLMA